MISGMRAMVYWHCVTSWSEGGPHAIMSCGANICNHTITNTWEIGPTLEVPNPGLPCQCVCGGEGGGGEALGSNFKLSYTVVSSIGKWYCVDKWTILSVFSSQLIAPHAEFLSCAVHPKCTAVEVCEYYTSHHIAMPLRRTATSVMQL